MVSSIALFVCGGSGLSRFCIPAVVDVIANVGVYIASLCRLLFGWFLGVEVLLGLEPSKTRFRLLSKGTRGIIFGTILIEVYLKDQGSW